MWEAIAAHFACPVQTAKRKFRHSVEAASQGRLGQEKSESHLPWCNSRPAASRHALLLLTLPSLHACRPLATAPMQPSASTTARPRPTAG